MIKQMGLSMRFKAVKVGEAGCCLGIKEAKCLSLASISLLLKVDNFRIKSVIKLSES